MLSPFSLSSIESLLFSSILYLLAFCLPCSLLGSVLIASFYHSMCDIYDGLYVFHPVFYVLMYEMPL